MAPTYSLRDIAVPAGDVEWPAENGGNVARLGWRVHKAGSLTLHNPTTDHTFAYHTQEIELGLWNSGAWKGTPQSFQLDPGKDSKVAVNDGEGVAVFSDGWFPVANVGAGTTDAPQPAAVDLQKFGDAVAANLVWIVVGVIILIILTVIAIAALGGGQGVEALSRVAGG